MPGCWKVERQSENETAITLANNAKIAIPIALAMYEVSLVSKASVTNSAMASAPVKYSAIMQRVTFFVGEPGRLLAVLRCLGPH